MRVLVLAPDYPKPGRDFGGLFNERSVNALKDLCDGVEVLVPRPYVPPLFSLLVARWKIYRSTPTYEARNGVPVYRPGYLQIPRMGGAFWVDPAAFFFCRHVARKRHRRATFDAILSFDLAATGGLAWRIGRDLGIPATGWATGGDVRVPKSSSFGRAVIRALQQLDIIFYQSHELLEKGARLLGISADKMSHDRHLVLPRGIPEPPSLPRAQVRDQLRRELKIHDNDVLVLSIGRISREKGTFELLEAVALAAAQDSRITCVVVGSSPAYDESATVQTKLNEIPGIRGKVKVLPACSPDKVWEYLCAADIFAFTSHNEGMPNSLLEAMAMGVPAIAFAIPPVLEIDAGTGALLTVPPLASAPFAEAILVLASSSEARTRLGQKGRSRVLDRFIVKKNMAAALEQLTRIVQNHRLCEISAPRALP